MTREGAAQRLAAVSSELREKYYALGSEEIAVLDMKRTRWIEGHDKGITEFKLELDFTAYDSMRDVISLKADIAMLEEERDNLRFFIKYGLEAFLDG